MKIAIALAALLSLAASMPAPESPAQPSNVDLNAIKGPYAVAGPTNVKSRGLKGPYTFTIDQSAGQPFDIDLSGLVDDDDDAAAALETRDHNNILEKRLD
ncbi:MAG: hypothetical protein Q9218_008159, partial [Villophora microphyllina]